jgi:hypothetical protein
MTTHETDQPHEIDQAEEHHGVDEERPGVGDDLLDHTDPPPDAGAPDLAIDTEGLADPDADVAEEVSALDEHDVGTDADAEGQEAIALGPVDAGAGEAGADAEVGPDVEVVGATLGDEADVLDEPVGDSEAVTAADTPAGDDRDDGADGDGSVLLTESPPGSVLPPEEPEEPAEPEESHGPEEVAVGAESDAGVEVAAIGTEEPLAVPTVGPDAPIDPGIGTYRERWNAVQGSFVDDPLGTVESAGALVAEIWQEIERSIAEQRDALDGAWGAGSSTDDLRTAFLSYRDMFDRLTALLAETQPSG